MRRISSGLKAIPARGLGGISRGLARRCGHALTIALAAVALMGSAAAVVREGTAAAQTATSATTQDPGTWRLIVKLKPAYHQEFEHRLSTAREHTLSDSAGVTLRTLRPMSGQSHVLAMSQNLRGAALARVIERLRQDPAVESVMADTRERLMALPNDPDLSSQWYLQAPAVAVSGINAPGAWTLTTGSTSLVVAMIDTGVRYDHPDLAGRLLSGYDFVGAECTPGSDTGCTQTNQYTIANDGDGRDADATDPGDWVEPNDLKMPGLADCSVETSDWHGTHVAGIIGAATNNGIGIAGLLWNARLLPVRVAGKCGAYQSDVVDGIRWASGLPVPGVPNNPTPARIINISIGSAGTCAGTAYQGAISDVLARGAIVVAAAGNEDAVPIKPSNCSGVISVGALRRDGARTTYSNSGSNLTLMAPGGNLPDRIYSTSNAGTTTPLAYSAGGFYDELSGTSFSAPMVTGIVALMVSVNPTLAADQARTLLQQAARPFVAVSGYATCVAGGLGNASGAPCNCTTAACGAGMADASASVTLAQATPATNLEPVVQAMDAQTVTAGGSVSFTVYAGDPNGDAITLSAVTLPTGATFNAATGVFSWSNATPAGTYTFAVRANDGKLDSAIASTTITVQSTGGSSSGGGGGGGIDVLSLVLLAGLILSRWQRRRR